MDGLSAALGIPYTDAVVVAGALVLGVTSGVLGAFAVLRRRSLVGDAVAHATLPGVCVAFLVAGFAIGVRQPTLTHHLDAMERAGLVTRERPETNRRVQVVTVTESGQQLFLRLRRAAASFDGRLRAGLADDEVAELRRLLGQLEENARPD